MISCKLNSRVTENITRLNYNKGNYCNLRKTLQIDWNSILASCCDVETKWSKFKEIVNDAVTYNIPMVNNFSSWKRPKWKRPLGVDIRTAIHKKRKLWKSCISTRDANVFKSYKKQTNLVRQLTRKAEQDEQTQIAKEVKDNPKKIWSYVNKKTKSRNKIGDLKINGTDTVAKTDCIK